jgi:two-component system NtrC family response regulator
MDAISIGKKIKILANSSLLDYLVCKNVIVVKKVGMINILFIEDDLETHRVLKMVLPKEFNVISTTHGKTGLELVKQEDPDIVLLDINLPDIDGIQVLESIVSSPPSPPVVMLTGYSETELVVRAVRKGACDYITKPYNLEKLQTSIEKAAQLKLSTPPLDTDEYNALDEFIGESGAIKEVKRLISLYARSEKTILISGESGTGKEIVARRLHRLSHRRSGPFVPVNCGAVPPSLFETEFFGSVRGAYTDAVSRSGSFEAAENGTLFLDEIGEMDLQSQVKLLRTIESREFSRLGSTRRFSLNVRIITATNQDLKLAVERKQFRHDLFYRIHGFTITVPPLRERKEDIPLLAHHFLEKSGNHEYSLLPAAIEKLNSYSWPGNVREFKHVVERAAFLSEDRIIRAQHISF